MATHSNQTLRPQYPCLSCVDHRQERIGIEEDEDGNIKPILNHFCQDRPLTEAEMVFGCGLWRSKR